MTKRFGFSATATGVRASQAGERLLISGTPTALSQLAQTIDHVALAAELAGPNPHLDRHADLDSVTNSWMAPDATPLEIAGRVGA